MYVERLAFGLQMASGGVIERQAGVKGHDSAPRTQKLLAGILLRMGLAGDFAVQHANLIGAYNQMCRITCGQRLRFLLSETRHQMTRGFTRLRRLINVRRGTFKRDPELFQQHSTVGRSGSKYEIWHIFITRYSVSMPAILNYRPQCVRIIGKRQLWLPFSLTL